MNVTSNKIETFNKWKDFYEKSFTKIPWTPQNQAELYVFKFNKLKEETEEDFKDDIEYEESILHDKLEDIKRIPLVNKDKFPLIDNFDKIFKEQYNTLYNIYWTKDDIENYFGNNVNEIKYEKYLDYISNLIYLKLYKDLNMIYILLNTFMETNKITRSMNSLPIGVDSIPIEQINIKNILPVSSNTGLNPNEGKVNNNRQGVSIPKENTAQLNLEIQNCSKKIQKSINNTIKEISNNVNQNPNIKVKVNPKLTINELNKAVNNCSKKLEINIKDFIKGLNSNNVKEGGTIPSNNTFNSDFLVEVKNLKMDTKEYNEKLKNIKKAYEDGLKDNIKGFKELCKILKEYIENKNKIVTDFIDEIRIKKKEENDRNRNIEDFLKKRAKYLIIEKKKEKKENLKNELIRKKKNLDKKIKQYESIQEENKKFVDNLSKSEENTLISENDISVINIRVKEKAISFEEEIIKDLKSRIDENEIELNKNKDKIKKYELDIENLHNKIMVDIEKALDDDFKKTIIIKELNELKDLNLNTNLNLNPNSIDILIESKQNEIKEIDSILEKLITDDSKLIKKEEKLEGKLIDTNNTINELNITIEGLRKELNNSEKNLLTFQRELDLLNNRINIISNRKDLFINKVRDLEERNEDIFYISIEIPELKKKRNELNYKISNLMDEIDELEEELKRV